ncbi:MAG: hypothetical protein ACOYIQ_02440 [Christensenellales bacterium]|jgi:hypothetical protein
MKKLLLFLLVLVLSVSALSGCSKKESVPGSAWATRELLTYTAKEGEEQVGELKVRIARISEQSFNFEKLERDITIKNKVTKGTYMEVTYRNAEDELILENCILMDGFDMAASYRWEKQGDNIIETAIIYGGKGVEYYSLKKNGALVKDGAMNIKARKGVVVDGGALYIYFRCYDVETANFSATVQVPDVNTGKAQALNFSRVDEAKVNNIPLLDEDEPITVDCIKAAISRTASPIGKSIYVYYAKNTDGYKVEGENDSFRIPVRIEENNITYTLTKARIGSIA